MDDGGKIGTDGVALRITMLSICFRYCCEENERRGQPSAVFDSLTHSCDVKVLLALCCCVDASLPAKRNNKVMRLKRGMLLRRKYTVLKTMMAYIRG